MHPACADYQIGTGCEVEDEGCEVGVVLGAGCLCALGCLRIFLFVGDEVVVGGWY